MIRWLRSLLGRVRAALAAPSTERQSATIHQIANSLNLRFGPPIFVRGGAWLEPLRTAQLDARCLREAEQTLKQHWDIDWGSWDQEEVVGIKLYALIVEWRLISSNTIIEQNFRRHLLTSRGSSGEA